MTARPDQFVPSEMDDRDWQRYYYHHRRSTSKAKVFLLMPLRLEDSSLRWQGFWHNVLAGHEASGRRADVRTTFARKLCQLEYQDILLQGSS